MTGLDASMPASQVRKGARVTTPDGEQGGVIATWTENRYDGYRRTSAWAWARVKLEDGRMVSLPFTALKVAA